MHGFVTSPPILTQPQADGHAATEQRRSLSEAGVGVGREGRRRTPSPRASTGLFPAGGPEIHSGLPGA